jgi:hypothetical protein
MLPGSEPAVIELEYRGVIPMHVAFGARIDCLSGRIWITEERSTDDIVLEAGESFDITCAGVAVVQALRKAAFALQVQAAPRPTARPAAPVVLLREPSG